MPGKQSKPKASTQIRKARNAIKSGGINSLKNYVEQTKGDLLPETKTEIDNLETKWELRSGPKARFK
jgi:hypothetical protein